MAKIEKSVASPYVAPVSKWSTVWNRNDYFLAENTRVFDEIYAYFQKSIASGVGHMNTYQNWMAEKGAIKLTRHLAGNSFSVGSDEYEKYRDMWTKFSDWLYFKEQKRLAAEKFERESIENLAEKMTMKPVAVEPEMDEVTRHALDHF